MCRFLVYVSPSHPILLADLLTKPSHSLIKQSFASTERKTQEYVTASINADGFGISWYEINTDPTKSPCLFTSVTPAWSNKNLWRLSDVIKTPLLFAHVRAAPMGSNVTESNCHPFVCGKYTFMHNGGYGRFKQLKKTMMKSVSNYLVGRIQGSTDSEHIFMMFLNNLPTTEYNSDEYLSSTQFSNAFLKTLYDLIDIQCNSKLETASALNFAASDGNTTVCCRICVSTKNDNKKRKGASLYYSIGSEFVEVSKNTYKMKKLNKNNNENVVIVASERLTKDSDSWFEVPPNHLVIISENSKLEVKEVFVEERVKRNLDNLKNNNKTVENNSNTRYSLPITKLKRNDSDNWIVTQPIIETQSTPLRMTPKDEFNKNVKDAFSVVPTISIDPKIQEWMNDNEFNNEMKKKLIENKLTYDMLLNSYTNDLRDMCDMLKFNAFDRVRFLTAVKKLANNSNNKTDNNIINNNPKLKNSSSLVFAINQEKEYEKISKSIEEQYNKMLKSVNKSFNTVNSNINKTFNNLENSLKRRKKELENDLKNGLNRKEKLIKKLQKKELEKAKPKRTKDNNKNNNDKNDKNDLCEYNLDSGNDELDNEYTFEDLSNTLNIFELKFDNFEILNTDILKFGKMDLGIVPNEPTILFAEIQEYNSIKVGWSIKIVNNSQFINLKHEIFYRRSVDNNWRTHEFSDDVINSKSIFDNKDNKFNYLYVLESLISESQYWIKVRSSNKYGHSQFSDIKIVKTSSPPKKENEIYF